MATAWASPPARSRRWSSGSTRPDWSTTPPTRGSASPPKESGWRSGCCGATGSWSSSSTAPSTSPWEDVHRYAEELEHSASDELIEIVAAKLGDPIADPHGDPIPSRDLVIDEGATDTLANLEPGEHATLVRVSDSDSAMLRYLSEQGIGIGDRLEMVGHQPFDGPCEIRIGERRHDLGLRLARAMRIERASE